MSKLIEWTIKGHETIVRHLLKKGVNTNQQDKDGRTPLMIAAMKGYYNITKLLLQRALTSTIKIRRAELLSSVLHSMGTCSWPISSLIEELTSTAKTRRVPLPSLWLQIKGMIASSDISSRRGLSSTIKITLDEILSYWLPNMETRPW